MELLINKLQKENAEMAKKIAELEQENEALKRDLRVTKDLLTIASVAVVDKK